MWMLVLKRQYTPAGADSYPPVEMPLFKKKKKKKSAISSPAPPCWTTSSWSDWNCWTVNPNSLRFLKMLLRTQNHRSGVGGVMHCSLRSYKRVRFYNHWSDPFNISGSLLANQSETCFMVILDFWVTLKTDSFSSRPPPPTPPIKGTFSFTNKTLTENCHFLLFVLLSPLKKKKKRSASR